MKRPSYAGSRLQFDVECYRNDRANGMSVLPALWACATPRGRLAWRINDVGSALMDLSRKLCPGCPSLDNPTMETAFSMLDHFGVTMGEVARLAQSKREALNARPRVVWVHGLTRDGVWLEDYGIMLVDDDLTNNEAKALLAEALT